MPENRKKYTREFKLEAVQLAKTSGKSISQIERDLGLSHGTLFHWRRQFTEHAADAFPGRGHLPAPEEQPRQLERENAILKQERDILKKAIAVRTPMFSA